MIQVSPGLTIYVINEPISFQYRMNGTLAYCRDFLKSEPMDGGYFVFRNRSGAMLRILFYDGDGFWLCEKVFSKGKVLCWYDKNETGLTKIEARELAVLLWHGNPSAAGFPPFWKKI